MPFPPEKPEAGGEQKPVSPKRDIKPLMDEVDQILSKGDDTAMGPSPGGEPVGPEGEPMGEGEAAPAGDMKPLMDALSVDKTKAQQLYDAAQTLGELRGLAIEELAKKLAEDIDLRMKVEQASATSEDMAAAGEDYMGPQPMPGDMGGAPGMGGF